MILRRRFRNFVGLGIIVVFGIFLMFIVATRGKIENASVINTYEGDELSAYKQSLDKYEAQLSKLKKDLKVKNFLERKENDGEKIFFFGMGNRRKMLYKDGRIIDYDTKDVIADFEYDEELIIPNEYMVVLKNGDEITKIFENEEGVYIETSEGDKFALDETGSKLKLPEFEDKKYSEVLKVLHQEVLFNMRNGVPIPNLRAYNQTFYRDAVLGAMVLEETGNIGLYSPWVENIEEIYDYARGREVEEADSLGGLLYLIGATGVERIDLIEKIMVEIDEIRDEYGGLAGPVDGTWQEYYPTALALLGAEKLGITTNLEMPSRDDGYAKLTWYADERIPTNVKVKSGYYPYLNWAFYHYDTTGNWQSGKFSGLDQLKPLNLKIEDISTPSSFARTAKLMGLESLEVPGESKEQLYMLDEIYPLSYEAQEGEYVGRLEDQCYISDFYCEHRVYMSHLWAAAEMFLALSEIKN